MSAAAYHRGKGRAVYIRVPAPGGGSRLRSTKTSDKRVARDMRDALAAMKRRKMWRELQAVLDGAPGFTLDDVRDAWAAERLSSLTAKLADADLEPYVARWHDALAVKHAARAHAERPTADHYRLGTPCVRIAYWRPWRVGYSAAWRASPGRHAAPPLGRVSR